MRDFARATWLPTALFTAATLPLYLSSRRCGLALALGPTLTALLVVPAIWHWCVPGAGRHRFRRAALAGASAAYLIATLSHVIVGMRFSLTHSWSQLELGALGVGLTDLFVVGGSLVVAAPVGAMIGSLVARIQRGNPQASTSTAERTAGGRQGASTAVMIAILLSPVLAAFVLASSQELLVPLSRKYSIGYAFALGATWLVSIPVAAVLGARRAMANLRFRRAWIPTVGLLAVAMAVGSMHGGRWAIWSGLTSLVLAPLLWPWALSREGLALTHRGAAAGAAVGFLAQLVPAVVVTQLLRFLRTAAPSGGGGQAGVPVFDALLLEAIFAALVGAALGAVLARHLASAGPPTRPGSHPAHWHGEGAGSQAP